MFITVNYGPIEHAMYYSKIALEPKFIYPKYHKGYDYALGHETISCLLAYTQTSDEKQQQIRKCTTFICVLIVLGMYSN